MKKLLSIIFIFSFSCTTYNQEKTNLEGDQILVGEVNWSGFAMPPYEEWFFQNYVDYQVDSATLIPLKTNINNYEIQVFLGTWCSDSQLQVPQFYKILGYLEHDLNQLAIIALEKSESGKLISPQHEEAEYAITHVPTFIFLKDGKE